jgi:hypothetical protein
LTLRELLAMAESREREAWGRTASIMMLIANANRDPKKTRPFKPSDFDPFAKSGKSAPKVGVEVLKSVFIERRMPDPLHQCTEAHQ